MKAISSVLFAVLFYTNLGAQVPILNSYPSAKATIYLDFDGEYVQGTSWNWSGPIDAAPAGLSDSAMREIFNRVSEDYRIFNINITTDSTVYEAAPLTQRIRVIITPTYSWYGMAGGVSFVGSFTWGDGTPSWVFSSLLSNNPKNIAEAASHEAGHTLGLQHQSTYNSSCSKTAEYNAGQGSGEIGWAPIMGVGYSRNITTWYNGPNTYACNYIQNDISVIAGPTNNFGLRSDDYGNTRATASPVTISGFNFQASGIVNDSLDKDVFEFSIPVTTAFHLDAIPDNVGIGNAGANIDLKISLLDAIGDTIGQYNPLTLLDAGVDSNLNAGNYYLVVQGVSNVNMTSYGSLGYYSLTGSLMTVLPVKEFNLSGQVEGNDQVLNWQLVSDEKIARSTLEYSTNGHQFTRLADLNTSGEYRWKPELAGTYYYRIKAVTAAGLISYSNILQLQSKGTGGINLQTNLVHDQILLTAAAPFRYQLVDATGRLLQSGWLNQGSNRLTPGQAASGLLFLRVEMPDGVHIEKIMKQ